MSRRGHRFCLVSLGCPKNTVDSEGLLGAMSLAGFRFMPDPAAADVCIVNTCGFLDAARREAAAVLEELASLRARRERPLLVAAGCLVERVGGAPELAGFLEAADACVGFADYPRLPDLCRQWLDGVDAKPRRTPGFAGRTLPRSYLEFLNRPRMRIGSPASACLKLGEGCSNNCSYCSIPLIRGRRVSRSMTAIVREARQLVDAGARELNLIAQDTTAYGMDIDGTPRLGALLTRLLQLPDPVWFRLLYTHPRHLTEDVLRIMASDPRICPYIDLPLQHVSSRMLKAMGRGVDRRRVEQVLGWVRRHVPEAAIRTTFIVGHPGEGEREFNELLAFVQAGHFDHMGVFVWSPEPGTVSARMNGRVPPAVAEKRRDRLMQAQTKVSQARLRARKGSITRLLLEGRDKTGWRGRTPWQAPDVDGVTRLARAAPTLQAGDIVPVILTGNGRYDCRARPVEE